MLVRTSYDRADISLFTFKNLLYTFQKDYAGNIF